MKNLLPYILTVAVFAFAKAQVGIGTTEVDESAVLEIAADPGSGYAGIKLPVLSTAERNSLSMTADDNGMMIYNSSLSAIQVYSATNTAWSTLRRLEQAIAPVATEVALIGSNIVGNTLTGSYQFADGNSDQEAGSSLVFFRADDNMGTNEAFVASGSSYTLSDADDGKFIRFGVTPVDDSNNNNTGSTVYSPYTSAIVTNKINLSQRVITLAENANPDDINLRFLYQNASSTPITVTVAADDYSRLDETGPQTFDIPASQASPFTAIGIFNVFDDNVFTGDAVVNFTITNVTGGDGTNIIGATPSKFITILEDENSNALLTEQFESDGNNDRYTLSLVDPGGETEDYFRIDNEVGIAADFNGTANGDFFAAQDIDGVVGASVAQQTLTFSDPIAVTSGQSYSLSLDLAEDDDGTAQDWDGPDFFKVEISEDGGATWIPIFAIESNTSGINGEPSQDTDFDGIGDGVNTVTDSFSSFSQSFTPTVNSILVRLNFSLDSGDEDIAVDNIQIQ